MCRHIILASLSVLLSIGSCSPLDDDIIDDPIKNEQTPEPEPEPDPEPEPVPEPEPESLNVPEIRIYTEEGRDVESKDEYLDMNLFVKGEREDALSASGRIKGRGNATWGYEKKPYKIKFDEKQPLLGYPANKEWVLLAEYCDKSLMRTAYMCELAKTVGMPYPINYHHVELYLNDEYLGIYLLTDQVEKKSNRVAIEDDGFLFENDNYFWEEPLNFMTCPADIARCWCCAIPAIMFCRSPLLIPVVICTGGSSTGRPGRFTVTGVMPWRRTGTVCP